MLKASKIPSLYESYLNHQIFYDPSLVCQCIRNQRNCALDMNSETNQNKTFAKSQSEKPDDLEDWNQVSITLIISSGETQQDIVGITAIIP